MSVTIFDIALGLILFGYAILGIRRGLVLTATSAVGFVFGAAAALWLLPGFLVRVTGGNAPTAAALLLVVGVLLLGTLGQTILARLAWPLRHQLRRDGVGGIDSLLGGLVTLGLAVVIVWFAAGVLRVAAPDGIGRVVSRSQILTAIDHAMPKQTDRLLGRVVVALDRYGVPRAFSGLSAEPIMPVDPANSEAADTPGVRAAASSIVRIDALALACGRSQEGTGWVAAPGLVVTNAHVVAGAERVTVTVFEAGRATSRRTSAEVVAFDPKRDLAVLSVGLPDSARPLAMGPDVHRGDSVAVAGYPGGGPYEVTAGRVRGQVAAPGDDIYGTTPVVRRLYSVRGEVRPGNSGGPLLRTDGTVAGVVFARSMDDRDTAYALTLAELRPVLAGVSRADEPVGTGRCAA